MMQTKCMTKTHNNGVLICCYLNIAKFKANYTLKQNTIRPTSNIYLDVILEWRSLIKKEKKTKC